MRYKNILLFIVLMICVVSVSVSANQDRISSQTWDKINTGIARLNQKTGNRLKLERSRTTGIPSFISIKKDNKLITGQVVSQTIDTIPLRSIATDQRAIADQFFQENGDIFGMTDPAREMQVKDIGKEDLYGMSCIVHFFYGKKNEPKKGRPKILALRVPCVPRI